MGLSLGLSFGAKKSSSKGTATVDKTETTNQQQTGTNTTSGTTTNNTFGQSTGQTSGQQTSSQTGTASTTGSQTGTTSQTTNTFKDSTLAAIEKAVNELFGKTGTAAPVSMFDKAGFIADTVGSASNSINTDLGANLNQLVTNIGGTQNTNSMSALLSNRLRNDAAAQIAGVKSSATATAEEIARSNALATSQIAGQDQGFLGSLLSALKGGQVTTTGTESTQSQQAQQTQNTGQTNSTEQTAQQQSQQQVQTQQLIELVNQLMTGTNNTKGTETTTQKGKSMGGGFSVGM